MGVPSGLVFTEGVFFLDLGVLGVVADGIVAGMSTEFLQYKLFTPV